MDQVDETYEHDVTFNKMCDYCGIYGNCTVVGDSWYCGCGEEE